MLPNKKQAFVLAMTLLVSYLAYYATSKTEPITATQRLLTSTYTTTTTRTDSVNKFCSGFTRSTLVDSSLSSMYTVFNSQFSGMVSIDGNKLISNLLAKDYSAAQSQATSGATQLGLFIGPFVLGLVLILMVSPFVCCCCACPDSCPSKCCRKNEDEQYTKCELYWPTTILILALLLCIGACIAGFTQSEMIPKAMNSMSCASSIILDDIINGNVTSSGSNFFLGLKQLDTQLGNLNGNLTTINNSMSNLQPSSANMTAVTTAASNALSDTAKIPNNVNAGGNMNAIAYSTPLNSGSTTGTINSIFPGLLGSSNTGGYVGSLYTTINSVLTIINNISSTASNFVSEVNNFQSSVGSLRTTVQNFTNFTVDMDNSLYSTLNTVDTQNSNIQTAVKLVYGLTIGLASVMLLSTLLVAFCDKIKCRYLMYFTCVILFFIGVIGFLLSVIFSIASPVVYFGCQFLDFSLSSSTNFNSNFGNVITDSTIRSYVSTCLPSSSGDLVTALGGGAVNAVNNLSSSLTQISNFNVTQMASIIQTSLSTTTNAITNYQMGYIQDITDSSSISILSQISNASNYAGCTSAAFTTDSWIPSTQQSPVYLSCLISGGSNATSTQCGGANFAAATGGCSGCMDTTSVLNTGTYSTKANVLNALNNRYTAAGCSTFNNELANVWANYYLIKSNAYAPVSSRGSTATTTVTQFMTNITGTLNTTFSNAVTAMSAAASTVTDSKYGLVAGLNCRLIGQDFVTLSDTFCKNVFTVSYFSRLALGCASFGILFAICCGACTGVRFYKDSIRKLNSVDNAGLSEDEVQDVTNTNFVKPKILE